MAVAGVVRLKLVMWYNVTNLNSNLASKVIDFYIDNDFVMSWVIGIGIVLCVWMADKQYLCADKRLDSMNNQTTRPQDTNFVTRPPVFVEKG